MVVFGKSGAELFLICKTITSSKRYFVMGEFRTLGVLCCSCRDLRRWWMGFDEVQVYTTATLPVLRT